MAGVDVWIQECSSRLGVGVQLLHFLVGVRLSTISRLRFIKKNCFGTGSYA